MRFYEVLSLIHDVLDLIIAFGTLMITVLMFRKENKK